MTIYELGSRPSPDTTSGSVLNLDSLASGTVGNVLFKPHVYIIFFFFLFFSTAGHVAYGRSEAKRSSGAAAEAYDTATVTFIETESRWFPRIVQ